MLSIINSAEELNRKLQLRSKSSLLENALIEEIVSSVKLNGDKAIRTFTERFDNISLGEFCVSDNLIVKSTKSISQELNFSIKRAIENIQKFHTKQLPSGFRIDQMDGTQARFEWRSIDRVGLYIPGGRYPLFSTLLMNVIPAQVAGVKEIAICSPPCKSNTVDDTILAVCSMLGISEIYSIGGAQAIAALAYGTDSIPAVDKITGPGNNFVTLAKKLVSSDVDIDMLAGPTELVVFADDTAFPEKIALDLIAQAEHDDEAWPVLISLDEKIVLETNTYIHNALKELPIDNTARTALTKSGFAYVGKSLEECISIINRISPEHLSLQVRDPEKLIKSVKAAAIFLGNETPPAWGDYWSGANHTLPTGGRARVRGPLSVYDFLVSYSVVHTPFNTLLESEENVIRLAETEGLLAHAQSIKKRVKND
ncbi:MAG: histidinol dehydrogenase [Candidatus Marinimicrobia bacterium]|nr:histidinol dehydrogenase [Candidatus Neomarinimicrobiota bacterium]|tara:strand:- start:39019 stop:40293 length:1275 start_codon:yes stop_codon:yes gene_type:complete